MSGIGFAPPGKIAAFGMQVAPAGWKVCDGSAISRTAYAALFAAIGTTWGAGDGSTTFNLPDLRGYYLRGFGTNGDGVASGAFAAKLADAVKAHTHEFDIATVSGSAGLYLPRVAAAQEGSGSFTTNGGAGIVIRHASGGTETRPASVAVLVCISTGGEPFVPQAAGSIVEIEKTIASGWNVAAHGLGREPVWFDLFARCKVASNGYSVGDVVKPVGVWDGTTGVSPIDGLAADAVNVQANVPSGWSLIQRNKSTGVAFAITSPNWVLLWRLW